MSCYHFSAELSTQKPENSAVITWMCSFLAEVKIPLHIKFIQIISTRISETEPQRMNCHQEQNQFTSYMEKPGCTWGPVWLQNLCFQLYCCCLIHSLLTFILAGLKKIPPKPWDYHFNQESSRVLIRVSPQDECSAGSNGLPRSRPAWFMRSACSPTFDSFQTSLFLSCLHAASALLPHENTRDLFLCAGSFMFFGKWMANKENLKHTAMRVTWGIYFQLEHSNATFKSVTRFYLAVKFKIQ